MSDSSATTTLVAEMLSRADRDPIGVDISDYGDEFCEGFLRGQVNALEELARALSDTALTHGDAGE